MIKQLRMLNQRDLAIIMLAKRLGGLTSIYSVVNIHVYAQRWMMACNNVCNPIVLFSAVAFLKEGVAVGGMANAVASKPQSPIELCWKRWLKASDPVIYKGCVVLLVMVTLFMSSDVKQCKEKMKKCSECVCQSAIRMTQLNLNMSLSLLKRCLHSSASLAYRKCNKMTVAESVASPPFSTNWRLHSKH